MPVKICFIYLGAPISGPEKRREVKGKGEREEYTHLNAEFQRKVRRDKETSLSNQCKEIEENNRTGKARDLLKKITDTKETFHAEIRSIKDKNSKDITGAEEIKKWWQEYMKQLYEKVLMTQITMKAWSLI